MTIVNERSAFMINIVVSALLIINVKYHGCIQACLDINVDQGVKDNIPDKLFRGCPKMTKYEVSQFSEEERKKILSLPWGPPSITFYLSSMFAQLKYIKMQKKLLIKIR